MYFNLINTPIKSTLILLTLTWLSFSGCSKDDVGPQLKACITVSDSVLKSNQIIHFQSCSENASEFLWDFGDSSSTSIAEYPEHVYKDGGTYTVTLTVTSGSNKSTTTKDVVVSQGIIEHGGVIKEDEIWIAATHRVSKSIDIEGATVTIEPGATIIMEKTTTIDVGYNGSQGTIIADGTSDHPIVFTSAQQNKEPGDWSHIKLRSSAQSTPSRFSYCNFEYGGGVDVYNNANTYQLIMVENSCQASFDHCTFKHSAGYGLRLDSKSGFTRFDENVISDIDNYGIVMSGNYVNTIGTSNQIDNIGILVIGDVVNQDVSWETQTCPYIIPNHLYVGADLTINAGVRLEFMPGTAVMSGGPGGLYVNGTAKNPVYFTAHQPDQTESHWGGIYLTERFSRDSYLKYAIIEKADDRTYFEGVIQVLNNTLNMENCQISGNKLWGVALSSHSKIASFVNNDIGEIIDYSMRIAGHHIDNIGEGNTFSSGKNINIHYTAVITEDVTWPAVDVAYEFDDGIYVGSADGNTLTLSPGVNIRGEMQVGATMEVSSNTVTEVPGGLIANGTSGSPIIFDTGDQNGPNWLLIFKSQTLTESAISNCTFSNADEGVRVVNIKNDTTNMYPVIANCFFDNLTSYGIYVANSTPDIANNTFTNIGIQNVKYQ